MKKVTMIFAALLLVASQLIAVSAMAEELIIYSSRNESLIKPLFDEYTKNTGIKIKYITDNDPVLVQRIQAEGKNTPADILITVDAGNLWSAANLDLFQPVNSAVLEKNIPAHFRDPQNRWFGLSVRARTLVYSTERIKEGELTTYEDLGKPEMKGRLCLRTSKKVYNQSLIAMFILEHGVEKTEAIVRSWVDNLAAAPFKNDSAVISAIAAGQCDVGVVNTYYYGRDVKKNPSLPVAIFWPNQQTTGVHVNVSGAGVLKYSKNKEAAVKFIEWLSSADAQNLYADENMEYPANPTIKPHATVAAWGEFKQNTFNVANAGALQAEAIKLMDRVGYR